MFVGLLWCVPFIITPIKEGKFHQVVLHSHSQYSSFAKSCSTVAVYLYCGQHNIVDVVHLQIGLYK